MNDYTDQDRERSQETHTMLKDHIKLTDERNDLNEKRKDKIDILLTKHDERISKNQTTITRIMAVGGIFAIPVTAALAALGKKFIGN